MLLTLHQPRDKRFAQPGTSKNIKFVHYNVMEDDWWPLTCRKSIPEAPLGFCTWKRAIQAHNMCDFGLFLTFLDKLEFLARVGESFFAVFFS